MPTTKLPPKLARALRSPAGVTKLDLARTKLTLPPPEIGTLTRLKQLDLSNNGIRALPDEIGNLVALEDLDLGGDFTIRSPLKVLPKTFAKLKKLVRLSLAFNTFKAWPRELDALVRLEELDLTGNDLPSLGPALAKMRALRVLSISYNRITSLPAMITKLTRLEKLGLKCKSGGKLRYLRADLKLLAKLPKLASLDLTNAGLRVIPIELTKLRALEELNLRHNTIRGDIPEEMAAMTALRRIFVRRETLAPGLAKKIRALLPTCSLVVYR